MNDDEINHRTLDEEARLFSEMDMQRERDALVKKAAIAFWRTFDTQ
jgi:hypothetical protein